MELAQLPSGPILVAVGGFGVKDQDRIGLITLEESPPRVLADEYLPTSELDALIAKIPNAHKGGWNTMHATGWSYAWSDEPFVLLDPKGRCAWLEGDRLHARELAILRSQITAVEPFVGDDWTERGMRVRLADGSSQTLASDFDPFPRIDPTYDGLNLMADTFWCHFLAGALSKALGVPIIDCTL